MNKITMVIPSTSAGVAKSRQGIRDVPVAVYIPIFIGSRLGLEHFTLYFYNLKGKK